MTLSTERPEPFFIGEHLALDFLNSVCSPWGQEIEWLSNGDDLLAWMMAANLLSRDEEDLLRSKFSAAELNQVAAKVRGVRESFRATIERHVGHDLSAAKAEIVVLNELTKPDSQYLKAVLGDQGSIETHWQRHWRKPEQLVAVIAQLLLELLASPEMARVKQCQGPTCTLWYVDISKNQKRRWCSMAVCGNRAKAAAHRARKK